MQETQPAKTIKCVVVGDDDVGKSSLIALLTGQETPPQTYADSWGGYCSLIQPTTIEKPIKFKRKYYNLSLWDTISFDRIRPLSYPDTNVFLVCFSIGSPASLANVRDKWLPEIQHFGAGLPFIIVGLQTELRDDVVFLKKHAFDDTQIVMKCEGEDMARKCSSKYIEGTVFEGSDLDCLPEMVVRAFVNQPKRSMTKCTKPGCMIL